MRTNKRFYLRLLGLGLGTNGGHAFLHDLANGTDVCNRDRHLLLHPVIGKLGQREERLGPFGVNAAVDGVETASADRRDDESNLTRPQGIADGARKLINGVPALAMNAERREVLGRKALGRRRVCYQVLDELGIRRGVVASDDVISCETGIVLYGDVEVFVELVEAKPNWVPRG